MLTNIAVTVENVNRRTANTLDNVYWEVANMANFLFLLFF